MHPTRPLNVYAYSHARMPRHLAMWQLYIPSEGVARNAARAAMPTGYSRDDTIHNIGRAAMLVNCFATGQCVHAASHTRQPHYPSALLMRHSPRGRSHNPLAHRVLSRLTVVWGCARAIGACYCTARFDALRFAMEDRVHQPYRSRFFPFEEIIDSALAAGAHGAFLSSQGPTVVAICGGSTGLRGEVGGEQPCSSPCTDPPHTPPTNRLPCVRACTASCDVMGTGTLLHAACAVLCASISLCVCCVRVGGAQVGSDTMSQFLAEAVSEAMLQEAERNGVDGGEVHVVQPSDSGLVSSGFDANGKPMWGPEWEQAQKDSFPVS